MFGTLNTMLVIPFLTNCSLLFHLQPHTFASEDAKVAFTIHHLIGRAHLWGIAKWELHKVYGLVSRLIAVNNLGDHLLRTISHQTSLIHMLHMQSSLDDPVPHPAVSTYSFDPGVSLTAASL